METLTQLVTAVLWIAAVLVLAAVWFFAWSRTPETKKADAEDTDLVP